MVEGFLFDGVDTETGAFPVGREDHFPAAVFTHEAETANARLHVAGPGTEVADDVSLLIRRVPPAAGL